MAGPVNFLLHQIKLGGIVDLGDLKDDLIFNVLKLCLAVEQILSGSIYQIAHPKTGKQRLLQLKAEIVNLNFI